MALRALFLAFPLALALPGSAQTVQLRFKPPVGKSVSYTMTMSMTTSSPMMPKPMAFTQTLPMTMRALSRAGTTTTMQTKTGQAKMTVPADSPMASMKAQMEKMASGTTTTTQVDELGNLKGLAANGGAATGMARGMGAGLMQGAQGVSYPKKSLKVGDTWGATMDMGKAMGSAMPGMKASGSIPVTYRLTALSGGVATIAVTMKGGTIMNMGASAMRMAMSSQGTMRVETATGLLKSMTTTADTDIDFGPRGKMRQHMVLSLKAN